MALEPVLRVAGRGVVVPGDDIDTDRIIPARYMKVVTFDGLGDFLFRDVRRGDDGRALGHPLDAPERQGATVLVSGRNFGCGSSREHAPLALAEAGAKVVIAEFYARIFYRNCVNGGYLLPAECDTRLIDGEVSTGDTLELDVEANTLTNQTTGKTFRLSPLGDVKPIIDAGGVFGYAREQGMIG